jgi:hypothetical protein
MAKKVLKRLKPVHSDQHRNGYDRGTETTRGQRPALILKWLNPNTGKWERIAAAWPVKTGYRDCFRIKFDRNFTVARRFDDNEMVHVFDSVDEKFIVAPNQPPESDDRRGRRRYEEGTFEDHETR